jgi:hypothetical protein
LSFVRRVHIVVRSQISFVRSLSVFARRVNVLDRRVNSCAGRAGFVAGRADSFVCAVREIAGRDHFSTADSILSADASSFSAAAAKVFCSGIQISVDAPTFSVDPPTLLFLATIFSMLAPGFSSRASRRLMAASQTYTAPRRRLARAPRKTCRRTVSIASQPSKRMPQTSIVRSRSERSFEHRRAAAGS